MVGRGALRASRLIFFVGQRHHRHSSPTMASSSAFLDVVTSTLDECAARELKQVVQANGERRWAGYLRYLVVYGRRHGVRLPPEGTVSDSAKPCLLPPPLPDDALSCFATDPSLRLMALACLRHYYFLPFSSSPTPRKQRGCGGEKGGE